MPAAFSMEVVDAVLNATEQVAVANAEAYRAAAAQRDPAMPPPLPARSADHIKRFGPTDVEPLTWFHSRQVPPFPLARLSAALYHPRWNYDETSTLQAVVLMLRYSERTGVAVTAGMMHRLFLAAMLVVSKAHHDVFPRNDAFAQATGMTLWEVNRLEVALVEGCGWDVQVRAEHIDATLRRVLSAAKGATDAPATAPAAKEVPASPFALACIEDADDDDDASSEKPLPPSTRAVPTGVPHRHASSSSSSASASASSA